jgi:hypothetical protein
MSDRSSKEIPAPVPVDEAKPATMDDTKSSGKAVDRESLITAEVDRCKSEVSVFRGMSFVTAIETVRLRLIHAFEKREQADLARLEAFLSGKDPWDVKLNSDNDLVPFYCFNGTTHVIDLTHLILLLHLTKCITTDVDVNPKSLRKLLSAYSRNAVAICLDNKKPPYIQHQRANETLRIAGAHVFINLPHVHLLIDHLNR